MDDRLTKAREEINEIDREMAELFTRRMKAVGEVANYKKDHGLQIFDETREKEVLANNIGRVSDKEIQPFYGEFLQNNMDVSKKYQRKLIEGVKVAYTGVQGAFAGIAAGKIFPEAEKVSYGNFEECYRAVERGECDMAVLPLENSFAGEVGAVMDLMFSGSLYISGMYSFKIEHCLLGLEGCKVEDITSVLSHPHALSQCSDFLGEGNYTLIEASNTAAAAKEVAESGRKDMAAVAGKEAAALYGLDILKENINNSDSNETRFAVFTRNSVLDSESTKNSHLILMFTVKNEAGALAKAINVIGAYDYNMSAVRSRPLKSLPWQYYFYVEATGNGSNGEEGKMLRALEASCENLKVLGRFSGADDKFLQQ